MCILSYFPPGVEPDVKELTNGARCNPDGHGWASITSRNEITTAKSMDSDEAISRFAAFRARDASGPALFHSRIATAGLVDITGCHPFRVGQDNRTVVAHNGILFQPPATSVYSDTAIFARDILPRFGSLDSTRRCRKIEKYLGNGNKLVVLTVNPNRRQQAYLFNEDLGTWSASGAWHSNTSFEREPWWAYKTAAVARPWWDSDMECYHFKPERGQFSPWPCDVCQATDTVNMKSMVCEVCLSCQDCGMHVQNCFCYLGSNAGAPVVLNG